MTLLYVFVAVIVLFGLWLAAKNILGRRLCAICLAVSTTWLGLLVAYKLGLFEDQTLLALLMGQSIAGLYFLFEKRVHQRWLLFRLPVLLTLTYLFYDVLTWQFNIPAAAALLGLWVIFGAMYASKTKPSVKLAVKRLIECCGDW